MAEWSPGTGYVLETTSAVQVPMRSNRVRFEIAARTGDTTPTQSMEYAMKGGLAAPFIEGAAMGRMRTALRTALQGLQRHVESGTSS